MLAKAHFANGVASGEPAGHARQRIAKRTIRVGAGLGKRMSYLKREEKGLLRHDVTRTVKSSPLRLSEEMPSLRGNLTSAWPKDAAGSTVHSRSCRQAPSQKLHMQLRYGHYMGGIDRILSGG